MKRRLHINEVVTRDGFQNEPDFVPTETAGRTTDLHPVPERVFA